MSILEVPGAWLYYETHGSGPLMLKEAPQACALPLSYVPMIPVWPTIGLTASQAAQHT